MGYTVKTIPVDPLGRIRFDRAEKQIDEDTALVSVMWANNETGNIYPVEMLGRLAHRAGALFHSDAVQAVGKIRIDLSGMPVDFLSVAGHKIYGPKGIGALYVRHASHFHPFFTGGHQEHGRRAGTENTAGIIGLGKAAELAAAVPDQERRRIGFLRDKLEAGIRASIPSVSINGDPQHRLDNTLNVSFPGIQSEALLALLDVQGICASAGSACTAGSLKPSHVLRAMKLSASALSGAIRFSLGRFNAEDEVDRVLAVLPETISRLCNAFPIQKN